MLVTRNGDDDDDGGVAACVGVLPFALPGVPLEALPLVPGLPHATNPTTVRQANKISTNRCFNILDAHFESRRFRTRSLATRCPESFYVFIYVLLAL